MQNQENTQNDIREAQQEALRQTVAMCANLSHDSTLIILDYILNSSAHTPAHEIAKQTSLSIRTIHRHLERLKTHPLTAKIFTHTRDTHDTPEYYNINNTNNTNNNHSIK